MEILQLSNYDKKIVNEVVEIHLKTFKGFFLTFMGRGFLRQMYASYLRHNDSNLIIAKEDGVVVGFLSYSSNMSGLYKYMIKHRLIPFAWYSIGAFFRKPKSFMRLVRAFLKPSESKRDEEYVEVSSIGVSPECKSKGIGSKLLSSLKSSVDFNKFKYIALETDALNNESVNRFYVKNGFELVREYDTREGRKMNEYRYSGD